MDKRHRLFEAGWRVVIFLFFGLHQFFDFDMNAPYPRSLIYTPDLEKAFIWLLVYDTNDTLVFWSLTLITIQYSRIALLDTKKPAPTVQ